MNDFAPPNAMGVPQIIPSTGPHTQFYPEEERLVALVVAGMIEYASDYGPNARVYRPVELADENEVSKWMKMPIEELGEKADGEEG